MAEIHSVVAPSTVVHPNMFWDHFFNNIGQAAQAAGHIMGAMNTGQYYQNQQQQEWAKIIAEGAKYGWHPSQIAVQLRAAGAPEHVIQGYMTNPFNAYDESSNRKLLPQVESNSGDQNASSNGIQFNPQQQPAPVTTLPAGNPQQQQMQYPMPNMQDIMQQQKGYD